MADFFQTGPHIENTYLQDDLLLAYLQRKLPKEVYQRIEPGLQNLGKRAMQEIYPLGKQAEREVPQHVPYDAWGRRIDEIQVSEAWKRLAVIATEEALVSTAYLRNEQEFSRIHQMVRIYLYGPSAAIYTCPLAMTDGAARAIELYDAQKYKNAYEHIITNNPVEAWTSGQWMTEKTGGSDVGLTSTIAKKEGDHYRLYGTKWFTSATTSQMAMTLARIEGAPEGSRGLSLFYLELRNDKKELNHIFIHRLKDKMGTKALPTAELTLNGTKAYLVGGEGDGVKKISSLFNITRVWNACTAASYMRRGLMLAKDYANKRYAFGAYLKDHPLHVETLARLEVEARAAFLLVMRVSELLGKEECNKANERESRLLRILTPLAKLYTAKQSIAVSSEVIESFGGAGYVEDSGLPPLLRDSQVLSIWEGTTNVLSLDVLRASKKENALVALLEDVQEILNVQNDTSYKSAVQSNLQAWQEAISKLRDEALLSLNARDISFALSEIYMAALLLEHWTFTKDKKDEFALQRWCSKLKAPQLLPNEAIASAREIVF